MQCVYITCSRRLQFPQGHKPSDQGNFGGHIHNINIGTLQWDIKNDKGRGHEWKIKES